MAARIFCYLLQERLFESGISVVGFDDQLQKNDAVRNPSILLVFGNPAKRLGSHGRFPFAERYQIGASVPCLGFRLLPVPDVPADLKDSLYFFCTELLVRKILESERQGVHEL